MLSVEEKEKIADLIEITAEISGNPFKPQVIALMVEDLAEWDFNEIQAALNACRREVKGRLSLKDIIDRLPKKGDELPTADEMWGAIYDFCTDERKTFVLPDMAFKALESTNGGIWELIQDGDKTGARMAFKGAYERLSQGFNGKVQYSVRLGTDRQERETAIQAAYKQGLIDKSQIFQYLPDFDDDEILPPPNPENLAKLAGFIAKIAEKRVCNE